VLDIRATHYVSPLSEVEFESIPLTVHITNVADETGLITGKFRVYNDVTGLLIHTSDIAPLTLAAGAGIDASALTDFDPPAAADDVYFVIFDGNASNALVPDGINFVLGKFDFDVKPVGMGPAPATHHPTHENGGADELEVSDLATSELDDTLVLQPDGAGGVEWAAVPAGVTDHDLLNNLDFASAGHTGFAPAAHVHAGDTLEYDILKPTADSTTALQWQRRSDSYVLLNLNSTNGRVGILNNAPASALDVSGDIGILTTIYARNTTMATHHIELNHNSHYQQFVINSVLRMRIDETGTGLGNISPTAMLDVNSNIIRLRTAKTPASAGAAGNAGDICWDADYIYVCVATNTWVRVETQTW